MRITRFAGFLVSAAMFLGDFGPAIAQINVADTYSRDGGENGADLGQTETGGFDYIKGSIAGAQQNAALLYEQELYVVGFGGPGESAPGLALIDKDMADVTMSSTMRFNGINDTMAAATGSRNVAGFILRRNGQFLTDIATSQIGFNASHEGQIEVTMGVGGGFLVREVHNGQLRVLLGTTIPGNPFGGAQNNLYSAPGQLPTAINGLPFDANGNGRLDETEPFQFGVNLTGNSLQVLVNGQTVHNLTVSRSAPVNARSVSGLYKNRYTSAAGLNNFDAAYDNLVMTGTNYTPSAVTPIRHQGDAAPLSEGWFPLTGTIGVANNGAVMDGTTAAWNINDASTVGGSTASFYRFLTEEQIPIAQEEGWTMKASISVLNAADAPDGAIELSAYASSAKGYHLWLGSDANGNPIVSEFSGTLSRSVTLDIGPGYHNYEMRFDPESSEVDVFVNGVLAIDNMAPVVRTGLTAVINRVLWGSNASGGVGSANYKSVEFIVGAAPEGLPGDFNNDNVVDGNDFLVWQRGGSPNSLSPADLAEWKANFGMTGSVPASTANVGAVPEPTSVCLVAVGMLAMLTQRRSAKR